MHRFKTIKQLVIQWAPLVWISPEEKYYPSSINHFLKNVQLVNENGKTIMLPINGTDIPQYNTKSLQLVTTCDLDSLIKSGNSFLNGHIPKMYSVPTYAIISPCSPNSSFRANILYKKTNPNLYFSVSYWTFYPFNKGKDICFLGKVPVVPIFGRCFGHRTTIGSHVGDWEHMTLFFNGNPFPSEMYIAIHNTGGYYTLAPHQQHFKLDVYRKVLKPKLPPIVRIQGGHPVLFSATGSHGLWPAPGEHTYSQILQLKDKCGYGTPWKTWKNLEIYTVGDFNLPNWLSFKGRWGNPKSKCFLFKKFGLCEYTDAPEGILWHQQDFSCIYK
ncbi:uncharacterized protein LOC135129018 isoform X2 [Zophobas morio]|uniref:uncharacterized protein LOC135129018 isoform X2 n=1 Tax=Zophobas morio TaxID=2755281 RepID=UPI0030834D41